jgi:hypothetical protein
VEESIDDLMGMLASLPVGYMFNYPLDDVPENFIEVFGQNLLKSEYMDLYQILRGNVSENGDYFTLPDAKTLMSLFDQSAATSKIIIRYR